MVKVSICALPGEQLLVGVLVVLLVLASAGRGSVPPWPCMKNQDDALMCWYWYAES